MVRPCAHDTRPDATAAPTDGHRCTSARAAEIRRDAVFGATCKAVATSSCAQSSTTSSPCGDRAAASSASNAAITPTVACAIAIDAHPDTRDAAFSRLGHARPGRVPASARPAATATARSGPGVAVLPGPSTARRLIDPAISHDPNATEGVRTDPAGERPQKTTITTVFAHSVIGSA